MCATRMRASASLPRSLARDTASKARRAHHERPAAGERQSARSPGYARAGQPFAGGDGGDEAQFVGNIPPAGVRQFTP